MTLQCKIINQAEDISAVASFWRIVPTLTARVVLYLTCCAEVDVLQINPICNPLSFLQLWHSFSSSLDTVKEDVFLQAPFVEDHLSVVLSVFWYFVHNSNKMTKWVVDYEMQEWHDNFNYIILRIVRRRIESTMRLRGCQLHGHSSLISERHTMENHVYLTNAYAL